jgi:hypothetical protein
MELLDLLDHLDAHGVALELNGDRIKALGPRDAIEAVGDDLRAHRDLLRAHLIGVATGHLLAFCEECHAPTLTAAKKPDGSDRETWPTCRDRPGCGGRTQHGTAVARHRPRPCDLAARRDSPAPPPARRPPPALPKARLLGPPAQWPGDVTGADGGER